MVTNSWNLNLDQMVFVDMPTTRIIETTDSSRKRVSPFFYEWKAKVLIKKKKKTVYVSPAVVDEIKRIIADSEVMK
jgi:dTDP-4-dehydrorhamnose 3,5-epimerase-like enzyme